MNTILCKKKKKKENFNIFLSDIPMMTTIVMISVIVLFYLLYLLMFVHLGNIPDASGIVIFR